MAGLAIKVEMGEFNLEVDHWSRVSEWSPLQKKIWRQVKKASVGLRNEVRIRMPVDTGRAKASWGAEGNMGEVSTSSFVGGEPEAGTKRSFQTAGIWEQDEAGLALTQGSFVPYIVYLEQGHSRQAPAGFISIAAELAGARLAELVGEATYYHAAGISPAEGPGY